MANDTTAWVSSGQNIEVTTTQQAGETAAECRRRHNEAVEFWESYYPPD